MSNRWKFQLSPNTPNVIGHGYRMDSVGADIENQVNEAMPSYLKFHGISKIVLKIGPNTKNEKDYREILNVGLKQWPLFKLQNYVTSIEVERREVLQQCVIDAFDWFQNTFEDAEFITKTRVKVSWLAK